jgi:hypothetical protein
LDDDLDARDIGLDFAYWDTGLILATGAAFLAKLIAGVLALIGILGIGFLAFKLDNGFLPLSPVF